MAAKTPAKDVPNPSLKRVVDDYNAWLTYTRKHRKNWRNYWDLWNGIRVKRKYKAEMADSFDPMVQQMIESRVDNIYGSRPRFAFVPTIPEQDTDTKILSGMLDYSWDKSDMDLHIIETGREVEITGNSIIFTGWEDGCMTMTQYPIADCIGDTTVTRPENATKVGFRRLALLSDLKTAERFDPTAGKKDEDGNVIGEWVPAYSNLTDIKGWSTLGSGDATDKQLKDQCYSGSTLPDPQKDSQVEVIKMHYFDKFIEVANRSVVIAEYDNPYHGDEREVEVQLHNEDGVPQYADENPPELDQAMASGQPMTEDALAQMIPPAMTTIKVPKIKPFLPWAMARNLIDPAQLLSKGTVASIADLQEDLNDEINIKKDNLIHREQNIGLVDANQYAEITPLLGQAKAGSLLKAEGISEGKIPVHYLAKPELANDADVEINRLKQSIRDTARVSEFTQGIEGTKNQTATEVSVQAAGASSSFTTQNRNLESGMFKSLGEQFAKMVQLFVTKGQLVRVVGPKGAEFKKFDSSKIFGVYDVKVTLESAAKAKEQDNIKRVEAALNLTANSPNWNRVELEKKLMGMLLPELDDDDLKLLINPNPQNATPMPGGAPGGDVASGSPVSAPAPMPAMQ